MGRPDWAELCGKPRASHDRLCDGPHLARQLAAVRQLCLTFNHTRLKYSALTLQQEYKKCGLNAIEIWPIKNKAPNTSNNCRTEREFQAAWLASHMRAAEKSLKKPLLLEEFGKKVKTCCYVFFSHLLLLFQQKIK